MAAANMSLDGGRRNPSASAWTAAGPDADRLAAAAQLLLALILKALEEPRRLGRRACRDRLDQGIADDERRVEAARQPLQAACRVDRIADDGKGQAVRAADITNDRRAVIQPDADRNRRLAGLGAL